MRKIFFSILIVTIISCTKDEVQPNSSNTPDTTGDSINDTTQTEDYKIWTGPLIDFTKENNADPTKTVNQDIITSNVVLTRGNSGEIYNVVLESVYQKGTSPLGTEWAIGDLSELESLTFSSFRTAVGKPKFVAGKKLVLHLTDENIYLSVEFTSWSQASGGGFTYKRSTNDTVSSTK